MPSEIVIHVNWSSIAIFSVLLCFFISSIISSMISLIEERSSIAEAVMVTLLAFPILVIAYIYTLVIMLFNTTLRIFGKTPIKSTL